MKVPESTLLGLEKPKAMDTTLKITQDNAETKWMICYENYYFLCIGENWIGDYLIKGQKPIAWPDVQICPENYL